MISNQNMTNDATTEKIAKVIKELHHSEDAKKLYDWYVEYISLFRKEYEKLSDEEKNVFQTQRIFFILAKLKSFGSKILHIKS